MFAVRNLDVVVFVADERDVIFFVAEFVRVGVVDVRAATERDCVVFRASTDWREEIVSVRDGEFCVRDAASANATHNNTPRNAKKIFLMLSLNF